NFESAFYRLPPALGGGYNNGAAGAVPNQFLPTFTNVTASPAVGNVVSTSFPFSGLTTHGFLLPYMEQDPLYNSMKSANFTDTVNGTANQSIFLYSPRYPAASPPGPGYQKQIKSYFSPADPSVSNGLNTTTAAGTRTLPANAPAPSAATTPSGATSY